MSIWKSCEDREDWCYCFLNCHSTDHYTTLNTEQFSSKVFKTNVSFVQFKAAIHQWFMRRTWIFIVNVSFYELYIKSCQMFVKQKQGSLVFKVRLAMFSIWFCCLFQMIYDCTVILLCPTPHNTVIYLRVFHVWRSSNVIVFAFVIDQFQAGCFSAFAFVTVFKIQRKK